MRQVLTSVFALSTAVALVGCAANRSAPVSAGESVALAVGATDDPAVLLGCSKHIGNPPVYRDEVYLSYVVDAQGKVETSSIRVESSQPDATGLRGGPAQPSSAAVTAAKRAAESCSYQPARVDGQVVRTRVLERFTF